MIGYETMTAIDLFAYLVIGLAFPLAILDVMRAFFAGNLPVQEQGLHFERRFSPWFWTVVLGPGVFVETCVARWRSGVLAGGDIVNAAVIALGWAGIYGYLLCALITYVQ
jgi:hypothetical protein